MALISRRFLLRFVIGVVPLTVILIFLLPTIQMYRERNHRLQCCKHLEAISAALQLYHDRYEKFPPAYFVDSDGRRAHSWRVMILRELGYESLYARYRFDEPWDGPHNRKLIAEMPLEFGCPADSRKPTGVTNYVAVVGCQSGWPAPFSADIASALDGTSSIGHVWESRDLHVPWTEPRDLTWTDLKRGVNSPQAPSISSWHPRGTYMALMDGSIQFLSSKVEGKILRRIGTMNGSSVFPGAPCDPIEEAENSPALQLASGLRETDVQAVMAAPIGLYRNVIYCASSQLNWDQLRDALGKETIQIEDDRPLVKELNLRRFPRDTLSSDSYIVAAGKSSDGVRARFNAERQQKFPNATLPFPEATPGAVLEAYCYLQKRLPFQIKFEKHPEALRFQTANGVRRVQSWGVPANSLNHFQANFGHEGGSQLSPESQVRILDYVDDQDFVLQLITLSDPIILAKVKPRATLDETWQAVAERVRNPRTKNLQASMLLDESLVVPCISLFFRRDYHELIGASVVNVGQIGAATQFLKFQLDEMGAILEAEDATMVIGVDDIPPPPPRHFVFDRPFLLALRQSNAEVPYFVAWIANTELLVNYFP